MHISQINYLEFLKDAFKDPSEAEIFINKVESLDAQECKAKIVLLQAVRMVWLSDRIDEVARNRPALQLLFYLIVAEAVGKIVAGYSGEGQSRYRVRLFFEDICSDSHRKVLNQSFQKEDLSWLNVRETIDFLYDVRCDVVHEGQYFNFTLREGSLPMGTPYYNNVITAHISTCDLRSIVLEGAVLGSKRLFFQYEKRLSQTI
jgi:hypothetical protein